MQTESAILSAVTRLVLIAFWMMFLALGLLHHVRLTKERKRGGLHTRLRLSDARSDVGMFLEVLSFGVLIPFRIPSGASAGIWRNLLAIALCAFALVLYRRALRELGSQFRIRAVVTEDHQLVTTGPYSVVRHPIYLCVLLGLVAVALHAASWEGLLIAVLVFVTGIELRIAAEESLLRQRFGDVHREYRARVPAYLPWIR